MLKIVITEKGMGNEAFQDGNGRAEVARILRDIASKVESCRDGSVIMDSNGNKVGEWDLELPEPEDDSDEEDDGRDDEEEDEW